MKAIVNPIKREALIILKDESIELYFDDLDGWINFELDNTSYSAHFHYDERMWFHVYYDTNYEKKLDYEVLFVYDDKSFN